MGRVWVERSLAASVAASVTLILAGPSGADAQRRGKPSAAHAPARSRPAPPPRARSKAPPTRPRERQNTRRPHPEITDRGYVAFLGKRARAFRSGRHATPLKLVRGNVVDAGSIVPGDSNMVAEVDWARTTKTGPLRALRVPARATVRSFLLVSFQRQQRGRKVAFSRTERLVAITTEHGGRVTLSELRNGRWARLSTGTTTGRGSTSPRTAKIHHGAWELVDVGTGSKTHRQRDPSTVARVCRRTECRGSTAPGNSDGPGSYTAYGNAGSPANATCHHHCSRAACVACCQTRKVEEVADASRRAARCHAAASPDPFVGPAMHLFCDVKLAADTARAINTGGQCTSNCQSGYPSSGNDNPHRCRTR